MNRKPDVLKAERDELRRALAFIQAEPHVLSCTLCTTSGCLELHRDGRIVVRTTQPKGGPPT